MKTQIKIEGMKCPHCASSVEKALKGIGCENVSVDLDAKCAYVTGGEENAIKAAVADAGFEVTEISLAD